ncbi:hypothetical protein [Mesorhizobium comanense]|uniref:hypothetical protein n=1 Tax=Mesorhizobium comanense TaxID=2502215 RepID=UPI001E4C62F7|nr:hypothetical protein [Mesorhizobium comanense]
MRRKTVDNLPAEAQAELKAYVELSYPLGRISRPDGPVAASLPSTADTRRDKRRAAHDRPQTEPGALPFQTESAHQGLLPVENFKSHHREMQYCTLFIYIIQ